MSQAIRLACSSQPEASHRAQATTNSKTPVKRAENPRNFMIYAWTPARVGGSAQPDKRY